MSKIGQYILEQIERGNYTLDERGKVNVSLSDRKKHTDTPRQTATDSIQGTGGRLRTKGNTEKAQRSGSGQAESVEGERQE